MAQVPMPPAVEYSPIGHLASAVVIGATYLNLQTGDFARCLIYNSGRITIGPRSETPETRDYTLTTTDEMILLDSPLIHNWPGGTEVARVIGAEDLNGLIANVGDHESRFVAKPTAAGQIPIGHADGTVSQATITAGANVTVTNGEGSISIAATGGEGGASNQITTKGYAAQAYDIPAFSVVHTFYSDSGDSQTGFRAWMPASNITIFGCSEMLGINPTLLPALTGSAPYTAILGDIVLQGVVENPDWTLTKGLPYYVGTNGDLIPNTNYSTGADLNQIAPPCTNARFAGWAISATKLYFCPDWRSDPVSVIGPTTATDNAIARFDSTTGKLIQNSGATLSDTGVLNLPIGGGVTVDGVALGGGGSGDAGDAGDTEDKTLVMGHASAALPLGTVVHTTTTQLAPPLPEWVEAEPNSASTDQMIGIVTGLSTEVIDDGLFRAAITSAQATTPISCIMGIDVDSSGNIYVLDSGTDNAPAIAPGILKFSPTGALIEKYAKIRGSEDGQLEWPVALKIHPVTGNIYITDGDRNDVQIFTPAGIFVSKFGSYGGGDGQFDHPGGIDFDSSGNIYVMDSRRDRVQKFTSAGVYDSQWGTQGSGDGQFQGAWGIAVDRLRNWIYVADSDNNRVQTFSLNGGGYLYSLPCPYAYVVAVNQADGSVYVEDGDNCVILKFNLGEQTPIATYYELDGPQGSSEWSEGICVDATGRLLVTDCCSYTCQVMRSGPVAITTASISGRVPIPLTDITPGALAYLGGGGTISAIPRGDVPKKLGWVADSTHLCLYSDPEPAACEGGAPTLLPRPHSTAIAVGSVVRAQPQVLGTYLNWEIAEPNVASQFTLIGITQSVGILGSFGFSSKFGVAGTGAGQFATLNGISVDPAGNIYTTEGYPSPVPRIQKFDSNGTLISTEGVFLPETNPLDYQPGGIAIDSLGNVFVVDERHATVLKYSSSGAFILQFGGQGEVDGLFNSPQGVAVDSAGNVYVADAGHNWIQKFTSTGTFITKWGSYGQGDGQFQVPMGVAVDGLDNVYVVDGGGDRVQKFTSAGVFIKTWGHSGSNIGGFDYPRGIAVDKKYGHIFVADSNNDRIQMFDSEGVYLAQWGSEGSLSGQFKDPISVAVDGEGNCYVVDTGNKRIQKFTRPHPIPSVAVSGIIPIPETSICPGYSVWLGAGGTLSQTSTGDVPKFLGWVVDSTHLYWSPQN